MGFLTVQGGRLMVSEPAKVYEQALDNALMQIQSGAVSYNQAISEQVKRLADRGLCVAYDKTGICSKTASPMRVAMWTAWTWLSEGPL